MQKIQKRVLLLLFIFIPKSLLANAGTALMWMPVLQLIFGNIIIGIVEGIVVSLVFKTKIARSILIMILANYASWLIGNGLILIFQNILIDLVFQLKGVFILWVLSLVILYALTSLMELLFIQWVINKRLSQRISPWKFAFIINAITYSLMIFIYLLASKYSFFTNLRTDQSILSNKSNFEILYESKGEIFKGQIVLNFSGEKLYELPDTLEYLHFVLKKDSITQMVDLYLANYNGDTLLFQKSFINKDNETYYPNLKEKYNWTVADFRDPIKRDWNARAGGWAIEGITITENYKENQNYAFEVPWMFWSIGQIAFINDSEVICIINDRIILLNKDTRKVAFITKGEDYMIRKIN